MSIATLGKVVGLLVLSAALGFVASILAPRRGSSIG